MAENTRWWHKSGHYDYFRGEKDDYFSDEQDRLELHSCSLYSKINGVVQDAMAKVKGLKLQDLPENSRVPFES